MYAKSREAAINTTGRGPQIFACLVNRGVVQGTFDVQAILRGLELDFTPSLG